jgi:ferritin
VKVQAGEEWGHATKLRHYLNEQNARVTLSTIAEPPKEWGSPLAVFEAVLEHEKKISASIRDLVTLAKSENDYATEILLQWFVTEQVEEEASALDIVDKLKKIKDAPQGLFILDGLLGQRK